MKCVLSRVVISRRKIITSNNFKMELLKSLIDPWEDDIQYLF